ncbi:MAG: phosphoenolpyruvate carboxylase [Flavobacteriales bacterium]|nr:phosphoenolpyruvate carboxylase [Flavobacteriales bacterium]
MDQIFQEEVALKYRLFNSIFLTLPFAGISDTGHLLPLLHDSCDRGLAARLTPAEILENFFAEHGSQLTEEQQITLLFRFVQYIERQVVLFDALEDSAYEKIHGVADQYSLAALFKERTNPTEQCQLRAYMNQYGVRVVLTAHPTQFYPGRVLSIITDLEKAIRTNSLNEVEELLRQLGRTPFYNRERPTPFEEAISLIWYLENVFYHSIGELLTEISHQLGYGFTNSRLLQLGFWPGGDRDGNPFVDAETTRQTGAHLRKAVLRSYLNHLHRLKRRLTFPETEERIRELERTLEAMIQGEEGISVEEFTTRIETLRDILNEKYDGLFADRVDDLLRRIRAFGFYFASLDLRQDSRVHHTVVLDILSACGTMNDYEALGEMEAMDFLLSTPLSFDESDLDDMTRRTLESIRVMKELQEQNGVAAAHRYIISNTQSALNLAELMFLFRVAGYEGTEIPVDWVPLFETVDDLQKAPEIMNRLWDWKPWVEHTSARKGVQPIMLGFSDGTKDGGYLMANWGIYRAKEELTTAARDRGYTLVFFDGRGGPPARGGGKTHQFYASLGNTVENKEIHLTIQGQTISSNFGTVQAAKHNLGQLLTAGVRSKITAEGPGIWSEENRSVMEELSDRSYRAYLDLKNHPDFLDYLSEMTVLKYYGATNIGSRPSKRKSDNNLNLNDLRAIPYVGSWSQMKQNVPGFYGLGTVFEGMKEAGRLAEVRDLYHQVPFFRALLNNAMQSLTKANYPLSSYIANDAKYGAFWKNLEAEYLRTGELLLDLTNMNDLMDDAPLGRASIRLREEIITPLLVIQQAALLKLRNGEGANREAWEKLVIRCFFGNINATRNAA